MEDDSDRPFTPDWYSPTGHSVREIVEENLKITPEEAAQRLGLSVQDYDALVSGELPVTDELAGRIAVLTALNGREPNPEFWKRREAQYQAARQRIERKA